MNTYEWQLGNGSSLQFTVYDQNTGWNKVPGLYIFARRAGIYWEPLYIGKADDFSSRLPNHERLNEAVRLGATHIHALVVQQAANRANWEQMLIQNLQPKMNVQYR
jgi:excinuclease UvrABC nuclease subunit